MDDLHFNSPLLRHMPRPSIRGAERAARIIARLAFFLPLAFLVATVIIVVQRRLLPGRGVGAVLYWLHDYVYLPLKGYTFTRFYPYGWIWWAVAATVVALALFSWLSDRSFVKQVHIRLLRLVIPRPPFHGILIRSVEILQRVRIRPGLMRAVGVHQWQASIIDLTDSELGGAPAKTSVRLANLTRFLLRLDVATAVDEGGGWWSLYRWHHAYLSLHAYADAAKGERRLARLMCNLSGAMPSSPVAEGEGDLDPSDHSADPFDPRRLRADLAMLAALGEKTWAGQAGIEAQFANYAELGQVAILKHLVESTEARRRYFYQAYAKMEGDLRRQAGGAAFDVQRQLPALVAQISLLPLLGAIALDVALHTALFLDEPFLAGAYLDAVDSVKLLLGVASDDVARTTDLRSLVQDTPSREAYRLLGLLQTEELKRQQIHWEFALAQHDRILTPELFGVAQTSAAGWYEAGPAQRELEQQ